MLEIVLGDPGQKYPDLLWHARLDPVLEEVADDQLLRLPRFGGSSALELDGARRPRLVANGDDGNVMEADKDAGAGSEDADAGSSSLGPILP